ncbi:MAG: toxin-antitoxin system TumE family protein [Nitrospirota bacterium]
MKAMKVLHTKEVKGDEIVEIKIWQVPRSEDKPHGIKYSIVYIKDGKRLLGYDNAEGKGDHRHYGGNEGPYRFDTIWDLIRDFKKDLKKIRGGEWDED